ncbi:hypothetical protein [Chryseobacterium indoltheticum]|uniref:hypothetical protein n=1 Tax=Chryseobacterium indoltheticum TaxID=254 RepID=UPI003F495061
MEGKIETALEIALSTNNLGALACVKGMVERTDKKHIFRKSGMPNFSSCRKTRQCRKNRKYNQKSSRSHQYQILCS